ncbi:cupin domain-containing protein [Kingella negevensis]|uniref:cupin domain-containing protein n=1 Tax=Kingella negevensis TaxID=1522312 RepID=UPI00254F9E98|nr:cupin domain-containing protein [Kingella negevensis]MDK4685353.1 cupin domain-containing protein [Kingella negevensis]MDK4708207.1 cupin domain-containing protein [Kingella negevensis]MDK4709773.1 cupin domain-containing protein [Kingella negevensis]
MDILDKLIEWAQIRGRVDIHCRFQGKWFVRHETRKKQALVHIVTSGSGWLKVDGEPQARQLKAGDVLFFPRLAAHTLSSETGCDNTQDTPLSTQQGAFTLKHIGNEQADLTLFCARFEYNKHADLLTGLPETVCLSMQQTVLEPLVQMLQNEAEQGGQGSASVIDALSNVLLVSMMRAYLSQPETEQNLNGVLQGLQDKRLRGLIQVVLDAPEQPWAVEEMVALANVSRAQLMRLFKQHVGVSPHAFVNHIRVQKAAMLLRKTQDSILKIALDSGFQSETHFGKIFKKQYEMTPGQYRKQENAA